MLRANDADSFRVWLHNQLRRSNRAAGKFSREDIAVPDTPQDWLGSELRRKWLAWDAAVRLRARMCDTLAIGYLQCTPHANPSDWLSLLLGPHLVNALQGDALKAISARQATSAADDYDVYGVVCQRCQTFLHPLAVRRGDAADGCWSAVCHRSGCRATTFMRPDGDRILLAELVFRHDQIESRLLRLFKRPVRSQLKSQIEAGGVEIRQRHAAQHGHAQHPLPFDMVLYYWWTDVPVKPVEARNGSEASRSPTTGVGSTNLRAPIQSRTTPRLNRRNVGETRSRRRISSSISPPGLVRFQRLS